MATSAVVAPKGILIGYTPLSLSSVMDCNSIGAEQKVALFPANENPHQQNQRTRVGGGWIHRRIHPMAENPRIQGKMRGCVSSPYILESNIYFFYVK